MTGELFRYQIIVPLLYEPYDVHSVDPDSEAFFVLDALVSMSWVRQTEQAEIEETVAGELRSREDGMFELELRYLYAASKAEVRRQAADYAEPVCRALNLFLAEKNVSMWRKSIQKN